MLRISRCRKLKMEMDCDLFDVGAIECLCVTCKEEKGGEEAEKSTL